jgi:hypothetical protein
MVERARNLADELLGAVATRGQIDFIQQLG